MKYFWDYQLRCTEHMKNRLWNLIEELSDGSNDGINAIVAIAYCDKIISYANSIKSSLTPLAEQRQKSIQKERGKKLGSTRLLEREVREIYHSNMPHLDLAKKYRVCSASISNIKNRKSWVHLNMGEEK